MLVLGTNKTQTILDTLPESFLIIDDGDIIDRLALPKRRKVTRLDLAAHSFNPLKGMTYQKARQFITILDAVFPEGANTLTKKNANFVLLKALLKDKKRTAYLSDLLPVPDKKDTGAVDAYQKIETILLSPVLEHVLNRPTNLTFSGIILARLDRAALGDFDCFVLGNLLISEYRGTVVIPDFGFYAIPSHIQLVRQRRLIAGVNYLAELAPPLRNLLLMGETIPARTTFEDAETLADYAGIPKHINRYADFIEECMGTKRELP